MNHLPVTVPENTLLASFDVESLYSNIPRELGIEAIKYWLRKYPNDTPSRFPKNLIIEGIEFILKNNTFCFNEKKYRQTKGTAMGTKFALVYATLVIGYLEEKLYKRKGCDEEYIGETCDTLRHRLTVHRQQIRDARVRILYVRSHIANCARFQPVKFTILPLYKMQTDCASACKMKEKHFIGLLNQN